MYLLYSLLVFSCLYVGNNGMVAQSAPSMNDYSSIELEKKSPREIFETANKALANHDHVMAIQAYKLLNTIDPLGEYSEAALVNLIQAYHDSQDIENVALETSQFIALYPTSPYLEKVCYLNASIYFRPQDHIANFLYRVFKFDKLDPAYCIDIEQLKRAIHYFTAFLEQFPNGLYAERARENIKTIHQWMARREYYIATFYFKAKNYIGAYNRIAYLLDQYPDLHDVLPKKYVANLDKQYRKVKQLLGLTTICSLV